MRGKAKAYIYMWTLQGITPAYAGKSTPTGGKYENL